MISESCVEAINVLPHWSVISMFQDLNVGRELHKYEAELFAESFPWMRVDSIKTESHQIERKRILRGIYENENLLPICMDRNWFLWMTQKEVPERAGADWQWILDYAATDEARTTFGERRLHLLTGYWLLKDRGMPQRLDMHAEMVANVLFLKACKWHFNTIRFEEGARATVDVWLSSSWDEEKLRLFELWMQEDTSEDSFQIKAVMPNFEYPVLRTPTYRLHQMLFYRQSKRPYVAVIGAWREENPEIIWWPVSHRRLALMANMVVREHRGHLEETLRIHLRNLIDDLVILLLAYLFPSCAMVEEAVAKMPVVNKEIEGFHA